MKFTYTICSLLIFGIALAQNINSDSVNFSKTIFLDKENKVIVHLKSKNLDSVLISENDFLSGSPRIKALNKRFTDLEEKNGNIVTFYYDQMHAENKLWIDILKVFVNDKNVLKIRKSSEFEIQILTKENFNVKYYLKLINKLKLNAFIS